MIAGRWMTAPTNLYPSTSKVNLTSTETPRPNLLSTPSSTRQTPSSHSGEDEAHPRPSLSERSITSVSVDKHHDHHTKDSHAARLKQILDEPALRSLFREFLRTNFCEENLSFWLDVQDFKRRFGTTSSAVAAPVSGQQGKGQKAQGHAAMEKHQGDLIAMAFVIYNSDYHSQLFPPPSTQLASRLRLLSGVLS